MLREGVRGSVGRLEDAMGGFSIRDVIIIHRGEEDGIVGLETDHGMGGDMQEGRMGRELLPQAVGYGEVFDSDEERFWGVGDVRQDQCPVLAILGVEGGVVGGHDGRGEREELGRDTDGFAEGLAEAVDPLGPGRVLLLLPVSLGKRIEDLRAV